MLGFIAQARIVFAQSSIFTNTFPLYYNYYCADDEYNQKIYLKLCLTVSYFLY